MTAMAPWSTRHTLYRGVFGRRATDPATESLSRRPVGPQATDRTAHGPIRRALARRPTNPLGALAGASFLVLTLAACGQAEPGVSAGASATASLSTSASATASPSPAPSVSALASSASSPKATPTVEPSTRPSGAIASGRPACPVDSQSGLLPSDHLIDLAISATTTHDLVTFVFAPQGTPTPAGAPRGSLEAAKPPFSYAGSGQEFELMGEHAVQVRFSGMVIADDSGQPTYQGSPDSRPSLPSLREVVQFDASEGVVAFDIGYNGPGCVTLSRDGNEVTVAIDHPEAPAG